MDTGERSQRVVVIALGAALLLVPTLFTVAPELSHWWVPARIAVLIAWVVVAVIVVRTGVIRDEDIKNLTRHGRDTQSALWEAVKALVLGTPLAPGYELTIFAYDSTVDRLAPILPEAHADDLDVLSFAPGVGATGEGWVRDGLVVATGSDVSDGSYGLSPAQQEHFRPYQVVAATPIRSGGVKVGMLSAISEVDDGSFRSPQGAAALRERADTLGVLLPIVQPELSGAPNARSTR